jgi:rhodanese-related sulfurtransferase
MMGFWTSIFGQNKVEGTAYNVMLKGLLSHTVPEISVNELKKQKDFILLDARELREYEVSHIEGAKFVGYDNYDLSLLKDIPKDKKVIVYCSVGYRSEKIAEKVKEKGFEVANLYGGIFEWKNQGEEVINHEGATQDVHAFDRVWGVWLNQGRKVYK